jgi:cytochrome c oxidase assembly protein subunit 15
MVAIMIIIGGLTRSTNSGLSMVEWKIISGIVPPITTNDWIELFNKYKQFPEYRLVNQNITLNDFQFIFWMEYIHRILGRLIFLVVLIPFIFFLKKKLIPQKLKKHFFIIIFLIMAQGLLGWHMVKSGLIDNHDVSQYRLSIHLIMAFIIYGYLLFISLTFYNLIKKRKKYLIKNNKQIFFINFLLILLILITVASGGFVAGLDAGLVYNTFPKMGDSYIPHEIFNIKPIYLNFFENPATVQFNHRLLGFLTFLAAILLFVYSKKCKLHKQIQKKMVLIIFVVILQVILGIGTLLSYVAIPIALTHQLGALILFSLSLWTIKSLPFVSK